LQSVGRFVGRFIRRLFLLDLQDSQILALAGTLRLALVDGTRFHQPEIRMPFKVQVASVDLMSGTANVVAFDQPASGPAKAVNLQFPFIPSGGEGHEKEKVIAAAKVVLQQALNEI
jgi:hypothetical protein